MKEAPALDEVAPIHGVITDKHPVDFYALGLAGCIDRLTAPLRREGTIVHWETPHHGIEIPARCAALLYQAAQEALSNSYKYAHASDITVRLAAVYHGIRLTVKDNGDGFDSHIAPASEQQGHGLQLMSVAARKAGGTVAIDSSPGHGTEVTVTLPLD
ncbi:sensor histidine kinase [Arthrobacter sp. ISL-30]|uniref:sensor histidine kinase n=1 Tax=Arthrobacter sp. ISL-30 TaxID=2819109 RepID=UPI001BE9F1E6|nr:ATP-binding protein [Arthrobacter sp. ISL-30]MBT2512550.1 ATP-binding protein [Arthrobacter sp. ISL-30]